MKLKNENELFFITNHHVISKSGRRKGVKVYNLDDQIIGEFYRSIYDDYYDVAFIKITAKNYLTYGEPEFKFGELKPTSFNIKRIMGKGMKSGYHKDKGYMYSSRAIVKIKNKWFKNQILLKDLGFEKGDSGSIIVERNIKDKKNVIGLHIGGNNTLSVANNIFNLLSNPIISDSPDKEPIINFESFIN